jgi:radical SAM-linked protein
VLRSLTVHFSPHEAESRDRVDQARAATDAAPDQISAREPRQRWRLVFSSEAETPHVGGREALEAWEEALVRAGLPIEGGRGPGSRRRSPIGLGPPLPAGVRGDRELADVVLVERLSIADVRRPLEGAMPGGTRLVDLYDVWLGAPSLASQVVAADYLVVLEDKGGCPGGAALSHGADALLGAATLLRRRARAGGRDVAYDLRPLLADLSVEDRGPTPLLRIRTRFDSERGAGRLDEVLAALTEVAGGPCVPRSIVRERILVAEDFGVV